MKKWMSVMLLFTCVAPICAMVARAPDAVVLLRSYYRYLLTQQVAAQVQTMTAPLPKSDAAAVQAAVTGWNGQRMEVVRQDLVLHFGEQGRPKFEQFFATYTEAEKNNDAGYLRELCGVLGARPPLPADYAALRQLGLNAWLQPDIQASSKFLADVQTWLQLKSRTPNMPPLNVWLARDATAALAVSDARVAPPPQKTVAQQLASAEAPMPEFKPEDEAAPGSNPLEAFGAQRKERRERAVKEAQEAMAQVAAERQAAEQEYASKKQAEASAEAEAMKNHAQRLADNEKQAIEQEKDSWSAKLKGIVGATITAAGGAFFGGVGAQAGQMAANFIFQAVPGLGGAPATAPATQ